MSNKSYIGDSVYADIRDDGAVILTTENGYGPSNTIFLEPEVMDALQRYVQADRLHQKTCRAIERLEAERANAANIGAALAGGATKLSEIGIGSIGNQIDRKGI